LITPLDIQNKEFKKSIIGYNPKAVDEFLDEVVDDYESVYKENIELKDKVAILTDQIRQFNTLQETLKNTLVVAQTTADEVTTSARSKANLIVEEAELSGKVILDNVKDDVRRINREYDQLKRELFMFKTRYRSFIQSQLLTLDEFYKEMDIDEELDTDIVEFYNNKDKVVPNNNLNEPEDVIIV
jgi:cell division initiation protein